MVKRLLYITVFGLLFFIISVLLKFHFVEAMPIAVFGCCLGWALAEFRRETDSPTKK